MADLEDVDPRQVPEWPEEREPTDVPVPNPEAVAQADEDNPPAPEEDVEDRPS